MSSSLRTNFRSPNAFDAEAVKRYGWHDHGIVVVAVDDPRLPWQEREILKAIGDKLYGRRQQAA